MTGIIVALLAQGMPAFEAARLGAHTALLTMNLDTVGFLILAQAIIFFLGWPLEWTEIIIIFVPIFLPMLETFNVDPLFFGILVALNLQTSFLTPPMAMAAYYLKGVAPEGIDVRTIYRGVLPFILLQLLGLAIIFLWQPLATWLPAQAY